MNDQESKTPKRSRRTSMKDSQKSPEDVSVPVLKTPRRTRRTSVQESQLELPKIDESNGVLSVSKMDPITPGKSTRTLDFRTPSRSENLATVQTPRRSCRKSIKPIQEYENIVAQKGLSVKGKRLLNEQTTSEEADETASSTAAVELRENKWTAAEIGRISTKRSKKKRNKAKELKRQKKIVQENEEDEQQPSVQPNGGDLHEDLVENNELVEKTEVCVEEATVEEDIAEQNDDEDKNKVDENLDQNDELEENKEKEIVLEKASDVGFEKETEIDEPSDRSDEFKEENKNDDNLKESPKVEKHTDKEEGDTEIKNLSTEVIPPPVLQIEEDNAVESDDSMDEGDIILNGMPVTGDDCMQDEEDVIRKETTSTTADDCIKSPEKLLQQNQRTSLLVTPAADAGNKSDDSDCIMLSLNDDSSRRNSSRRPSSVVGESKFEANESTDSAGINMPPLIVCSDDEDDDEEFVDALKSQEGEQNESPLDDKEIETLDGTFVTKENEEEKCNDMEVYPVEDEELIDNVMAPEEENIIDIVMGPEEIRKIVLGIEQDPIDITTPPIQKNEQMSPLNETFDADESPTKTVAAEVATPKGLSDRSSVTRHLTPFKTNTNILPDIIIEPEEELEEPIKIIIESRQNKLKSSRKRSFSFCVDRPKKNVTFHSPSNVTMNIYDGDLIKSVAKKTPTNITKRRKRSLSVTETDRDLMDYIQRKKPAQNIGTTPQKKKSPHTSKIKMPNFSNIHQKQFQRMESITDHVARRAERAKILINSSTKIKPASVQKGLPVKNSVLREQNKDGNKTQIPKPKARQRIDMSGGLENKANIKTRSKPKQDLGLLDDLPLLGKTPTKPSANSTVLFKQNNINKPTNPKFNFNFNSTALPSCGNTTVASAAPRIHLPNPRDFNLSTQITYPSTTSHAPKVEKVEDRRKRMMEMFKSKTTHRVVENKKEILKGVRTNRRFELQMMCRNRQN